MLCFKCAILCIESPLHIVKYSLCIYGLVFNNLELFSKHKNDNKFKYNLLCGKNCQRLESLNSGQTLLGNCEVFLVHIISNTR